MKSGTTSLRFTNQKSALESCHLHLEMEEEDNLLCPYNPCRHGYSFAGIEGSGMDDFDWFSCSALETCIDN